MGSFNKCPSKFRFILNEEKGSIEVWERVISVLANKNSFCGDREWGSFQVGFNVRLNSRTLRFDRVSYFSP